jgi:hypothetical protein
MSGKSLSSNRNGELQGATVLGPADFPLGSPQSRAAARFRLRHTGVADEHPPDCSCFPEDERPFFGFPIESEIAAGVKCPMHGDRFKPMFYLYVAKWRRQKEKTRRERLSSQYQRAWDASFPPALWPAEEEETEYGTYLRLKDGTRLLAEEFSWKKNRGVSTKAVLTESAGDQKSASGSACSHESLLEGVE